MTDPEFLKYREGFLKMLSTKTPAEMRGIRCFMAALIKMEIEQVLILIQELAAAEDRTKGSCKAEFDRIMKGFK